MTKTIYAQTSSRLLKEIPRFFGGFQSALAEMFQNAYRAGAESVIVRYDKEKQLLVISDDGPGLSDPQKLITAGETGWNENDIVEPAGMGAFSILRPEFVDSVEYQSYGAGNWSMTLTPEVLSGKPIQVNALENPDGRKGLTVILHLSEKQQITEVNIQEARALYPFNVTLSDADGIRPIEPAKGFDPLISITTPVGQFDWAKSSNYQTSTKVVWEYRSMVSAAMNEALSRYTKKCAHPKLAEALFGTYKKFCWTIDTKSGVRAKLPDRNDLISDISLENAVKVIVDSLLGVVLTDIEAASKNWPETLMGGTYCISSDIPKSGIKWVDEITHGSSSDSSLLHACLEALGWVAISFESVEEVEELDEGDDSGFQVHTMTESHLYKNPQFVVGSDILAFTLNNLGTPTVLDENAPNPKVEVKGLMISPEIEENWFGTTKKFIASPWIILADEIVIEGIGKVPYLLRYYDYGSNSESFGDLVGEPSIDKMGDLSIIFAGTPAECIAAINNDTTLRHLVAVNSNTQDWNSDWETDNDGDREVDWDRVSSDLEVQVMKAFVPADIAEKRDYMYQLNDFETEMTEIIYKINNLQVRFQNVTKQDAALPVDSDFSSLGITASKIDRDISCRIAELRKETELT